MRATPALAFLAAFLASSAVEVLAAPQAGLGFAAVDHNGGYKHDAAIQKRIRKRQAEPECAAEASYPGSAQMPVNAASSKHHSSGHHGAKSHVVKHHNGGHHGVKHNSGHHSATGNKAPNAVPPDAGAGSQPPQGAAGAPGKDGGVHCKGVLGSTTLASNGAIKHEWFDPGLVHHGPGTQFGGATGFWQGGACMLDSLPHANLPSVAMDQTFFQDGLACGTCVEIASTSASLFSNDAQWSVEEPKHGALPAGKKTIAIVSDLCPGVNQCWSGLDMHLDAWNSVTNNANGSKLPINWRFVNCKQAFAQSGSGGNSLQVHWREGANPGFFQVQIRGAHEAVVRVEMKLQGETWKVATHVDNNWWKWDSVVQDAGTKSVVFRMVDWQGQTITTEVPTKIGTDVFVQANFDRVESSN
ncbi:hypothetical protein PANT_12c00025 [Moesziomyces antarcticus T-34]|uniref:Expansin-like EG45 domain-containing protein n=1 Tax=Pseudozyma antarctica (strain T-34) TaxID=1151754 RepID=M9MFR7_PSEA3|nr:hypothetical protein PANT_12c00025 [Moesziomyces antarcticus T-34]